MYMQLGKTYLRVIELTRFEREAVWDESETDLLWFDTKLGVVTTAAPGGLPRMDSWFGPNPKAILTDPKGNDPTAANLRRSLRGPAPVGLDVAVPLESGDLVNEPEDEANWRSGAETDANLIVRLMQPRQKLILWAYERQTGKPFRWLESPRPGMVVDANNGPITLSADVVSAIGQPESVAVHVQVQTFVPPCPAGTDKFILSHRWTVAHEPDENHYLSRIVEGTVRFHAGALIAAGVQPDWFRRQLLHPIPVGFERKPPRAALSPDGLTLKYRVVDTDPTITFDPGNSGATFIDIQEKVTYNSPLATGRQ